MFSRLVKIIKTRNLTVYIVNYLRKIRSKKLRLLVQPLNINRRVAGLINSILSELPSRMSYLEIGIFKGETFQNIVANERWGVDIDPAFDTRVLPRNSRVFTQTSDSFFAELPAEKKFDMVYIDAEHTFRQAYRELVAAFNHLEPDGVILLDDTVPENEIAAIPDEKESKIEAQRVYGAKIWPHQGDVWKLIFQVTQSHPDLEIRTVLQPSRPRTIMWRRDRASGKIKIESTAGVDGLLYKNVFASGIPNEFGVKPLAEILDEIRNRV